MKKSFVIILVLLLIGSLLFAGCKSANNKVSDSPTESAQSSPEAAIAEFEKLLQANNVEGTSKLFLSYDEMNKLLYPKVEKADYDKYKNEMDAILSFLAAEGDVIISYCGQCVVSGLSYSTAEARDDDGKVVSTYKTASTLLNISSKGHYSIADVGFAEYDKKWKITIMSVVAATPHEFGMLSDIGYYAEGNEMDTILKGNRADEITALGITNAELRKDDKKICQSDVNGVNIQDSIINEFDGQRKATHIRFKCDTGSTRVKRGIYDVVFKAQDKTFTVRFLN